MKFCVLLLFGLWIKTRHVERPVPVRCGLMGRTGTGTGGPIKIWLPDWSVLLEQQLSARIFFWNVGVDTENVRRIKKLPRTAKSPWMYVQWGELSANKPQMALFYNKNVHLRETYAQFLCYGAKFWTGTVVGQNPWTRFFLKLSKFNSHYSHLIATS